MKMVMVIEMFDEESAAPSLGDMVRRPLHGLPYDRVGTVSSVQDDSRPKPWIQVEWIDGRSGWYTEDELAPAGELAPA